MSYKIEYLPIGDLTINPENPRLIKNDNFKSLVKSLADCPSLFDARPCICSDRTGRLIILGGNMRMLAAKELKYEKVPVIIMKGLTELQEREILLKDNGTVWGEWDFDLLSSWYSLPLVEWGVKLPVEWSEEILDFTPGDGQNKQTTYDKLAEKKDGVLFTFGDIQHSVGIDVYEKFLSKINMDDVKDSLIEELTK